ncbi:MAG: GAF domain-containing protein [Thermodesulfovibrionales bacterium]|nr:GAF domain-containing protein [Thermodesulfovibrionales bacterium]
MTTNISIEKLNSLIVISGLINSSLDISEIRRRAIESALKLLKAEAGSILFVDNQTGELFFDTAIGEKGEDVKRVRLKKGQGIAGWVVENRKSQIVNDVQSDKRFFKEADDKSGFKTRNMICVPLITKHKILGVFQVINKIEGDFLIEDLEMLTALSNQVAIAVENAQLYDELRETFYSTIHALADTVEKRDLTTAGHTKRVTKYSVAIGKELNLSPKDMVNLKLASLLHDIGKIALSDEVLNKQRNLNYHEQHLIKMHPIYGAEILSHIKNLKDIVPSVKYHHERHNGSGYPDGLQGDDIPFFARIIGVADSFDILACSREMTKSEALKMLQDKVWTEYDGEVVNAFVRAYKKLQQTEEGL